MSKQLIGLVRYSLVVCRNTQNKFLCVQEKNKKWWIVGGSVEKGQTYQQAAIREALEEAAIALQLKGILAIDSVHFGSPGMRVIYYAEPFDHFQQPKQSYDQESTCAAYLTLEEIEALRADWRAPQIYHYARYLSEGGQVFPLWCLREQPLIDDVS